MHNNNEITEVIAEKTWLNVPYHQKENAKSIAGKLIDGSAAIAWDKQQQCWYAKPGVAKDKIKAWLPKKQLNSQEKALSPHDEFSQALMSLGAIVSGEHPIMDGNPHRIATEGDKKGEKAGFYVAHLDGIPAGYIKNHRTGDELKWKCTNYVLTDKEKSALKAQALENKEKRLSEIAAKHQSTSLRLREKLSKMNEVSEQTGYMKAKGIQVHSGVYSNEDNSLTCIPGADINGKLWTVQYIKADGTKRFAKDSKKEGCFHVIGGLDKLSQAPVIVIAEGYATAATIKEATDLPAVVSAFDAGNLKSVATALHTKYSDKLIIIAADDDLQIELSKGINVGVEKAQEAALAVKGFWVTPFFGIHEQSSNPKRFVDFNDVANHSSLGIEGVQRQLNYFITQATQSHQQSCQPEKKLGRRCTR